MPHSLLRTAHCANWAARDLRNHTSNGGVSAQTATPARGARSKAVRVAVLQRVPCNRYKARYKSPQQGQRRSKAFKSVWWHQSSPAVRTKRLDPLRAALLGLSAEQGVVGDGRTDHHERCHAKATAISGDRSKRACDLQLDGSHKWSHKDPTRPKQMAFQSIRTGSDRVLVTQPLVCKDFRRSPSEHPRPF
jgi:hypothetical protein